jgi:dephospho-CoA kinase
MTTSTRPATEPKDVIIGIAGLQRSGKDTLADMLIKDGYFGVSFGDIVREFARERHADKPDPISVPNMTDTSNWLREMHGPDVILQEALKRYKDAQKTKDYKGLVLYSVRAPAEVDWIFAHGGILIWVEASDDVRYQRAVEHKREGETVVSKEEYIAREALQWKPQPGIPVESQMNISYVKDKASAKVENNGNDIAAFRADVEEALASYL